ncbi:hypothetical protein AJ80_05127 [Polytolypa hystricis UAMH7299]|uniref:NADPH-dependent FMN reductase-like domain-containing protein n=1 Tax=Polytolypa hystricis (strain UAMH7299) TaxID=1447883 RepID=A0A2B7Y5Z0_POLH7|nr:hypothetical protein AJ80_05127 [Polytolypa hystricis UAMH7299]
MSASKSIAVVVSSTRTPRVGPNVAAFVQETVLPNASSANLTLQTVDVASFNLPVYNEAVIPAMVPEKASFAYPHSIAWSAEMKQHSAFIFVVPEYNFGMAAATKNAIDYLYNELVGKPVLIVSYGILGGTNASAQVKTVLTGMKMKVVETRPALSFTGGNGPDLYKAMGEGVLGEDTRKAWEGEKVEELRKAFEELKRELEEGEVKKD